MGEALLFVGFRVLQERRLACFPAHRLPKADLYYLHGVDFYPVVASLAEHDRVPVIYDAHDYYQGIVPEDELPSFDRDWLMPTFRHMEERCIASACEVITVSTGTANLIEAAYHRRPGVLRNCHDKRLDAEQGNDLRHQLGLGPDERLVAVVGNHKLGMAIPTILDALALLPETIHLAFLGRGYEAVAERINGHDRAKNIRVIGAVPPDQIVPSLCSADVGVVPYVAVTENYRLALPNGFFQLVSAGLPVVYPDLAEIRALGDRYSIGICEDLLNPRQLAAAILRLIQDADARCSAKRGSALLAQQHSWAVEERALGGLIARVLLGGDFQQLSSSRTEPCTTIPIL